MTVWLDSKAVEHFHDDLETIPTLYADLPAVKTGIKSNGGGAHKPPASKPPLSIEVVSLLDIEKKDADQYHETDPRGKNTATDILDRYGVIPRVGLWLRMIVEEMTDAGETPPAIAGWLTLSDLCQAIKQATPWLLGQQWVTELAADMHALRAEIEAALGIAKEFHPKCRNLWCGTLLEPMDNGSWYSCPGCKREYVIAADLQALGGAQYMTAADVAQLLDTPWSTIRYWKQEKWIHPIAVTSEGIDLYDLDQVKAIRDTPADERVRQ